MASITPNPTAKPRTLEKTSPTRTFCQPTQTSTDGVD